MSAKKKLVVLSGAGISAESGIKTFRDSDGLWEGYSIEDVATPEGWRRNPQLVLDFYNERRKQGLTAEPNAAHLILAELEKYFDVQIITQNVDNLHERAGSKKVLHLHGELYKSRSTKEPSLVYDIEGWELKLGDKCELGSQLRPNIVWFHEEVPMMVPAVEMAEQAEIFIVVGTSLVVYPAAGLVYYVPPRVPIFVVDPKTPEMSGSTKYVTFIQEKATVGMAMLKEKLIKEYL
ncbi:SIR2 family NAD-dependent protein deacylase [Runella sp.]|uniref:SIR2 family NAD-dependent protein deacylase n=1 Tax=Runella sp. TaxID=1960881 RepID=UPI003D10F889